MWVWARLFRFVVIGTHMHKMFLAKAQGLSRLHITAQTRVGSQSSLCEICGERNGAGTGFLTNTYSFVVPFSFLLFYYLLFFRFILFPYIPPIFSFFFLFLHSFLSLFILSFPLWPFIPDFVPSLCENCGERSGARTDFPLNAYSFVVPCSFFFFYSLLLFRFLVIPSIPPIFSFYFFYSFSLSSHRLFSPSLYGHSFPISFPVCVRIVAKEVALLQIFH